MSGPTASDLDGVGVLKKVTGTLHQQDRTHTHLAQKMDKLGKELEEAGLVDNPLLPPADKVSWQIRAILCNL